MKVEEASYLFKVLSDEGRLNIIKTLYSFKKLCGNDLLMVVDCKQATLSHHMAVLTESGLVDSYKDGNKVFYSVNKKRINALAIFLNDKTRVREVEEIPEPIKEEKPVVVEIKKELVKPAPKVEPKKEEPKVEEKKEEKSPVNNSLPTFLL